MTSKTQGKSEEKIKVPHMFPIKRILVPIDGSANSIRASKIAITLARDYHSELVVLHVMPMPGFLLSAPTHLGPSSVSFKEYFQQAEKKTKKLVDDALKLAERYNVPVKGELLRAATASVVKSITDFAESKQIDLIVIGTRGLGGFSRLLLGSVSSGVVTHAHCSVLVVR